MINQFDVFKIKNNFIVNIQCISNMKTYVCCIAIKTEHPVADNIFCLPVKIDNQNCILILSDIITLNAQQLRNKVDDMLHFQSNYKF